MNKKKKNRVMIGVGAVGALVGAAILGYGLKKNQDLSQLREYALHQISIAAQKAKTAMGGELNYDGRIAIMKLRRAVLNAKEELEVRNAIGVANRIRQLSLENPQDMRVYIERVAKYRK